MDTYMAGTEGTGQYVVIAQSNAGRLGVRQLGGSIRVRFEPGCCFGGDEHFEDSEWDWNVPNGAKRYSVVVKTAEAQEVIDFVVDLMGTKVEFASGMPSWVPVPSAMKKSLSLKQAVADVKAAVAKLEALL